MNSKKLLSLIIVLIAISIMIYSCGSSDSNKIKTSEVALHEHDFKDDSTLHAQFSHVTVLDFEHTQESNVHEKDSESSGVDVIPYIVRQGGNHSFEFEDTGNGDHYAILRNENEEEVARINANGTPINVQLLSGKYKLYLYNVGTETFPLFLQPIAVDVGSNRQASFNPFQYVRVLFGISCKGCDLSHAPLAKVDLSHMNLYNANLSFANLSYANMTYTNLTYAVLNTANMFHTDFSHANLSYAYLKSGANLTKAVLHKADLPYAQLTDAYMSDADLSNAICVRAYFDNSDLSGADLSYADLFQAHLKDANLSGANLSHANLSQATLINANLSEANLTNAFCYETSFEHANLFYANLSNANLSSAILSYANLRHANLTNANLSNAFLGGATWIDGHICQYGSIESCN